MHKLGIDPVRRGGQPRMTSIADTELADEMGRRVAHFVRQAYPKDTRKRLAQLLGVGADMAKVIIGGKLPPAKHLGTMAKAWGAPFVLFVYEPAHGDLALLHLVQRQAEATRMAEQALMLAQQVGEDLKAVKCG